ncbi:DUF6288 domain-containing protein [Verrucomicrobiaceae bacterium 227]
MKLPKMIQVFCLAGTQFSSATPIELVSTLDASSWALPGGEMGTVVSGAQPLLRMISVPELSAKDQALPGKWRGVISLDVYGSPSAGKEGLLLEAIDPATGEAFAESMVQVSGKPPKANWAVIVSSEQGKGTSSLVFDGKPETDWHSRYGKDQAKAPHWIGLAFGKAREIEGVSYLPRQGGFTNGVAKDYRVEVREASGDWKTVAKGTSSREVADDRTALVVKFEEKMKVEGVRFVIESDWSGGGFGTAAELVPLGVSLPPKDEPVVAGSRAWLEIPAPLMEALVGKKMGLRARASKESEIVVGALNFCRLHEAPTSKLFGRSNGGLGPDKLGAGLLGFDALIEHQQTAFTLMNVRKGSAAAQAGLKAGDVVVSVNGVPLPLNDLNPGWNWFERSHEAILGRASESVLTGTLNKMTLGVLREGVVENVELMLRRKAAFSSMNPADDAEAAVLLDDLLGYLEENQREDGSWSGDIIRTTFSSLALLATKEKKHERAVKKAVEWAMKKYPNPEAYGNLGYWSGAYAGILYAEWFLQTGDKRVLPYLTALRDWAVAGQHQSKWEVPALGHGPSGLPYDQKSLVAPSCHLLVFEALARRCGMESEIWELLLPYMTLAWSDPKEGGHGSLGYNKSYKDLAEFWSRSGLFAMAAELRGEEEEMEDAMISFMHGHHPWIRNSHAYGEPGGSWGLVAMNLCAPEKYDEVIRSYAWWFSLAWEPGYGLRFTTPHMGAPYMGEDDLINATYALVLQSSKRNLHITGFEESEKRK